ncbi:MAG: site-specific DNA-methyltransferase [Chloroflexi bacterium]|nr:site-specific DNA-methyltransferase [Chloroflexota bacterium]
MNPLSIVPKVHDDYAQDASIVVHLGSALPLLKTLPTRLFRLIITSPPYNLGKQYEEPKALNQYLNEQEQVIEELIRCLADDGSLCWQVGNFVDNGEVYPLDTLFYPIFKKHGLKLRNRIIWHFGHGLHASRRFSGRYETLLWFTRSDRYVFNLDKVRVPAQYPGKTFYKGPNRGKPSGNPLGKNPSDVWTFLAQEWENELWEIPNVKANHPEKTEHPCQFPVELVERCVLAFTRERDWVFDPYMGVGSTLIAGLMHDRRVIGCDKEADYVEIAKQRIRDLFLGRLKVRKMGTPVYAPTGREKVSQIPIEWKTGDTDQ